MTKNINFIISKNVKKYRKQKKLTQAQLAEKIDRTVEMVCQIENNMTGTKLSTLEKMADVFEIEPYQLLLSEEFPKYDQFSQELLDLLLILQQKNPTFLTALTSLLKSHLIVDD